MVRRQLWIHSSPTSENSSVADRWQKLIHSGCMIIGMVTRYVATPPQPTVIPWVRSSQVMERHVASIVELAGERVSGQTQGTRVVGKLYDQACHGHATKEVTEKNALPSRNRLVHMIEVSVDG